MTKPKKIKLIKNVPYEIEWVDAFGYTGWFSEEEIDERIKNPATTSTVGYFVKAENGIIVLAMDKEIIATDFMPYSGPKFIPQGYIKNIRKL